MVINFYINYHFLCLKYYEIDKKKDYAVII